MNRRTVRMISILTMLVLLLGLCSPAALADGETETPADLVQAVINQLEAIDTLEQMQAKRSEYTVKTHVAIEKDNNLNDLSNHEAVKSKYEAYVAAMFGARSAALDAYNALTEAQKGQIDSDLVAKLNDNLSTDYYGGTFSVSPRIDEQEYAFEVVNGGEGREGFGYEVSPHRVNGEFPQLFVLVDTSDGKTSWTPSGLYKHGSSNYEVAYCCDFSTGLKWGTDYKRVNLEDSTYYGPNAAKHIRAILQNSYPYLTVEDMKARLKSKGMNSDFVDSLTRADMISAVQMAVWTYANAADSAANGLQYSATLDIRSNLSKTWYDVLHEYTNELWDWFPVDGYKTYDTQAAYRVNNLAHFLCTLSATEADEDDIIITNVEVARAKLDEHGEGYNIGLRIYLNAGSGEGDNLQLTVSSGQTHTTKPVGSEKLYEMTIYAKLGDTIKVEVDGTQYVGESVYFYEAEPTSEKDERDASQNLVGIGKGETPVHAEKEFTFSEDIIEKGLRIYKTSNGVNEGYPISDITFTVYKAVPQEGEVFGTNPTDEQLARIAVEANEVASGTTNNVGYASIALDEDGTYLVVEEHNKDKVEQPVMPFFVTIPSTVEVVKAYAASGAETEIEVFNVLSVYPKNTPVTPEEPEPELPPTPDDVKGHFAIEKVDEIDINIQLEGAEFDVYRPAKDGDADTVKLICEGIEYPAVKIGTLGPTNENGTASMTVPAPGAYFLVETKAPDGYNLPKEAFKVTAVSTLISAETTTITNQRGHIMPETGGMGTTPLLTAGAMLIAAALILTLARKRRAMMK